MKLAIAAPVAARRSRHCSRPCGRQRSRSIRPRPATHPPPRALGRSADTRLVAAMKRRDLATVRELAAERVGVNAQDSESASALHWAAHWNDLDAAKLLLAAGADPNLANRFGVTPLHEAATVGNAAMLEAHARRRRQRERRVRRRRDGAHDGRALGRRGRGARRCSRTAREVDHVERWHGQTALMWAAIEDHADVVQQLHRTPAPKWIALRRSTTGSRSTTAKATCRRRATSAASRPCSSRRAAARSRPPTKLLDAGADARRRRADVSAHLTAARDRERPLHAREEAHRPRRRRRTTARCTSPSTRATWATTRSGRTRPTRTAPSRIST